LTVLENDKARKIKDFKKRILTSKTLLDSGNSLFTCANNFNMFLFEIFDSSSLWGNSVVTVVGVGVLYDLQA
jgi:hypothetical protein